MENSEIDISAGTDALVRLMSLLNQGKEFTKGIEKIQEAVHQNKEGAIATICEVLASVSKEMNHWQECSELLNTVCKWWKFLAEDREKLLLTISNLEMEKEKLKRKSEDPHQIYGPLVQVRKKLKIAEKESQNVPDMDSD